YETVAIRGKGARCALGLIIPSSSERAQHGVSLDDAWGDGGINSADQEHRLHACLDMLQPITQGIRGRGAARGDYMAVSAKPKTHLYFAGKSPHGSARDAEQADLFNVARMPQPVILF